MFLVGTLVHLFLFPECHFRFPLTLKWVLRRVSCAGRGVTNHCGFVWWTGCLGWWKWCVLLSVNLGTLLTRFCWVSTVGNCIFLVISVVWFWRELDAICVILFVYMLTLPFFSFVKMCSVDSRRIWFLFSGMFVFVFLCDYLIRCSCSFNNFLISK